MTLRAELLVSPTPDTISQIADACMVHRPWYGDHAWNAPNRRELTIAHIAHIYYETTQGRAVLWGVWRDSQIVGIVNVGDIVPRTDAQCHFVFFDHKLADKRDLCLNLMAWTFDKLDLHRLSVEIPTYARALAKFARKLGFRYEAEGRAPYTHKDEKLEPLGLAKAYVGSRRFRATLFENSWHDLLCLSILREEFDELYGRTSQSASQSHRARVQETPAEAPGPEAVRAGPDAPRSIERVSAGVHGEPQQHPKPAPADERTPAAK